jgi:hypothetical protein
MSSDQQCSYSGSLEGYVFKDLVQTVCVSAILCSPSASLEFISSVVHSFIMNLVNSLKIMMCIFDY